MANENENSNDAVPPLEGSGEAPAKMPADEGNVNPEVPEAQQATPVEDSTQKQKHKRLKKKMEDSEKTEPISESADQEEIKIPKKKASRKKRTKKKTGDDPDGEFIPASDAFDRNHLDADDYYGDENVEKKVPQKKPPSAGKIYFDEMLNRIKERKKKKNAKLTPEECQIYCRQLVEKMIAAATMDAEAIKNGQPGLSKLKMVNEVSEFSKPAWRNWCISEGAAVALASWIAVLPDGSLPNLSVRTKVLQVALQLPFQSNDLRDNDLGRLIIALWKHPDEVDSNRVLIRAIVQKWVRPMLGLASNYADMQQDYVLPDKPGMVALDNESKAHKLPSRLTQERTNIPSLSIIHERIDSKLKHMFRAIEARRKTPSKAAKVNMDGYIL